MICLGKNNYFRFNHPKEAARIKMENPNTRFSIVPDNIYPGILIFLNVTSRGIKDLNIFSNNTKKCLQIINF